MNRTADDKAERRLIKARKKHNARLFGIFNVGPRHTWKVIHSHTDMLDIRSEISECIVCLVSKDKYAKRPENPEKRGRTEKLILALIVFCLFFLALSVYFGTVDPEGWFVHMLRVAQLIFIGAACLGIGATILFVVGAIDKAGGI